jgi:hypothetical protein
MTKYLITVLLWNTVADHFSIVIRYAGVSLRRFVAIRCGFNLVTCVQRPLVIDRRGGTERNLNVSNGWQPITDAGVE